MKKIILTIIIVISIVISLIVGWWLINKKYCIYNGEHDNGIVTMVVGYAKCKNCHKDMILPSAAVPKVLCEDCGKKLNRCTQCGKLLIKLGKEN